MTHSDSPGPGDWASPDMSAPAPAATAPAVRAPGVLTEHAAPAQATAVPAGSSTAQGAPQTTTFRSWQPGIIPLRPQTFGEFISVPFKALRYNRGVIIGGPLLCVLVAMILGAAALWLTFTDPTLALLNPTGQLQGIEAQTVVVIIAAALALVLADAISSAIVAPGFARAVLGERITLSAALRTVAPRIWSLLLLWILSAIVAALAVVPGIFAVVVGIGAGDVLTTLMGFVALFAFMVPAIMVLGVIAPVARCALVLEQIGTFAAIRRSLSLIRGRFWWSVLIVFVTGLIINVAIGILQNVGSIGALIVMALAPQSEVLAVVLLVGLTTLIGVISYVFLYAYMGGVYSLIYIDVRIRFEGFDMDLARAAEQRRA